MKTLKNYLLFAFLISSTVLNANPIENLPKIMASIKSVHETNNEGKVKLKLIDDQGLVIFQQILFKNQELPSFDFSALDQGSYSFTIESEIRTVIHPITVKDDSIEQNNSIEIYKPLIKYKDKKIKITKYVLDPHEMKVEIIDLKNGKKVYKSVISDSHKGGIQLNLSRLPKGTYKVLVRNKYLQKEKVVELI